MGGKPICLLALCRDAHGCSAAATVHKLCVPEVTSALDVCLACGESCHTAMSGILTNFPTEKSVRDGGLVRIRFRLHLSDAPLKCLLQRVEVAEYDGLGNYCWDHMQLLEKIEVSHRNAHNE